MSKQQFFTATGDDGTTGLLGEGRVPKDHPRLEAIGAIDEAGAFLGLARAHARASQTAEFLKTVQRHLYRLLAEVAATPENAAKFRSLGAEQVAWLEDRIAEIGEAVPPPKEFILPGDSAAGAYLDVARTVVRRAERRLATLVRSGEVENRDLLRYLNRLSSLCYALELLENHTAGVNTTKAKED